MTKVWLEQEYTAILNVYVPNNRAIKYEKQKLIEMKKETEKPTIKLQTSTVLSEKLREWLDRKPAEELSDIIYQ